MPIPNDIRTAVDAVKAATDTGVKPEIITAEQSEGKVRAAVRNLSGPAMSLILVLVIFILTWGIKEGLWTEASEVVRASYVGAIGVVLAVMLGVVIWALNGGRPSKVEIRAGLGSVKLETADVERGEGDGYSQ